MNMHLIVDNEKPPAGEVPKPVGKESNESAKADKRPRVQHQYSKGNPKPGKGLHYV